MNPLKLIEDARRMEEDIAAHDAEPPSADSASKAAPGEARCALATGSPAAGRADALRKQSRRWWRLEQKAVLRRDYLAAHEYAALSDKYAEQADAAEQENAKAQPAGETNQPKST